MIAKAKAQYVRGSARKIRQVIDLIRGKDVLTSQIILTHVNKGCTQMVRKVLDAAISSAKQKGILEEQLFISKIKADIGPVWRRYRAVAFGRATPIRKKTAHLTLELDVRTK